MVSAKGLWASLLLSGVVDATWTITSVFVQSLSTYTYTDRYYGTTETVTSVYSANVPVSLKPSATITATPVSTYTTTSGGYYYDEDSDDTIVYVYKYYAPGAIPTAAMTTSTRNYYATETTSSVFVQTVEYTAPSSCPTPFTVTTTSTRYIPSQVQDQVSIKSTSTDVSTRRYAGESTTYTTTYVTAYMASTGHPTGYSATHNLVYSYYLTSCVNPGRPSPTPTGRSGGSGGSGTNNGDDNGNSSNFDNFNGTSSCAWSNCGNYPYWGIIVVTVLSATFLFGFLESYFWFSSLMCGQGTLRVGTVSWILLCLPVVFLTRRIPSRSAEDQERLKAQWKGMRFGNRLSLWTQWGLRYRYPAELLGIHPSYAYGNPAADQKSIDEWYGENGNTPQVPPTYLYQHAPQMSMATTAGHSQAPQLPPRVRVNSGRNSRSASSESALASVPEESGSSALRGKGKGLSEGRSVESAVGHSDPQVGRAPRVDDEEVDHSAKTTVEEPVVDKAESSSQPKDKGTSA